MWKALAWLFLVYGLLVCASAVEDAGGQRGMAKMFESWQQSYAIQKARSAEAPDALPLIAHFEIGEPFVAVSSGAALALEDDGVNAWLEWTPDRETAPLDLLGILLADPPPDANGLALRLRANYDGQVVVGVMERDGSSYTLFPEPLELDWTRHEFALDTFTLSDDSEDENGQLDADQLDTVLLAYLDVRDGVLHDADPRVISIDDVHFSRIRDNPLFPDYAGPGGGREGEPGAPGERALDRKRERRSERRAADPEPAPDR